MSHAKTDPFIPLQMQMRYQGHYHIYYGKTMMNLFYIGLLPQEVFIHILTNLGWHWLKLAISRLTQQ